MRITGYLLLPVLGALVLGPAVLQAQNDERPDSQSDPRARNRTTPQVVSQSDLLAVGDRKRIFTVTDGEGEGEEFQMTMTPREDGVVISFTNLYRLHLVREDGALCLSRMDILEEDMSVHYDPVVEFIPATARAGRELKIRSQARVFEGDGQEPEYSGPVEHTIQRITRARFVVPAGEFTGHMLEFEHVIDLDMAQIVIDLEIGSNEDSELVYWRSKFSKEKLGLFGSTTVRQLEYTGSKQDR